MPTLTGVVTRSGLPCPGAVTAPGPPPGRPRAASSASASAATGRGPVSARPPEDVLRGDSCGGEAGGDAVPGLGAVGLGLGLRRLFSGKTRCSKGF
ncbi:hypothetical protein [Streptomyces sp. NPDC001770]